MVSNMMKFSDAFWDERMAGFDTLWSNLSSSVADVRQFELFVRECATSEDQYVKQLNKITGQVQKFYPDTVLAPLWFCVIKELNEHICWSHMHYMHRLCELVKEVQSYCADLRKKKRKIRENETKTVQCIDAFRAARQNLNKTREQYAQLVKVTASVASPQSPSDVNDIMTVSSSSKADKKIQAALDEYKQAIERYNTVRDELERRYEDSCDAFQAHEETHLNQMKSFVSTFMQTMANLNTSRQSHCGDYTNKLDNVYTVDLLIQQFIVNKGTGQDHLPMAFFDDSILSSSTNQEIKSPQLGGEQQSNLIDISETLSMSSSNTTNTAYFASPANSQQQVAISAYSPSNMTKIDELSRKGRKKSTSGGGGNVGSGDSKSFTSIFSLRKIKLNRDNKESSTTNSTTSLRRPSEIIVSDLSSSTNISLATNTNVNTTGESQPPSSQNIRQNLYELFDFNKKRHLVVNNRLLPRMLRKNRTSGGGGSLSADTSAEAAAASTTQMMSIDVAQVLSRTGGAGGGGGKSGKSRSVKESGSRNGMILMPDSSIYHNSSYISGAQAIKKRSGEDSTSDAAATARDENTSSHNGSATSNIHVLLTVGSLDETNYRLRDNLDGRTLTGSYGAMTSFINDNNFWTDLDTLSLKSRLNNRNAFVNQDMNGGGFDTSFSSKQREAHLFDDSVVFPEFDDDLSIETVSDKNKKKTLHDDMNNLYESSESTNEESRGQQIVKKSGGQPSRSQGIDMHHNQSDYADNDESSSSTSSSESFDSDDEPKKILVKINELDKTGVSYNTSPDVLNQISKSLAEKLNTSSQRMNRIRRGRGGAIMQPQAAAAALSRIVSKRGSFQLDKNNNEEKVLPQQQQQPPQETWWPSFDDQNNNSPPVELPAPPPIVPRSRPRPPRPPATPTELDQTAHISSFAPPPPLPPLPADPSIYAKLNAIKNRADQKSPTTSEDRRVVDEQQMATTTNKKLESLKLPEEGQFLKSSSLAAAASSTDNEKSWWISKSKDGQEEITF